MSSVKNSIINIFSSFVLMPLGIVVSILVTRELGPNDKGIFVFLTIIGSTLLPILFFGVSAGSRYYISSHMFNIEDVYFSSILISIIHGLVVSGTFWFLFTNKWLGNTGNIINERLIYIVMLSLPMQSIYFFINKLLIATSDFRASNTLNISKVIINILSLLVLFFVLKLGLYGAVLSILVTNALILFITLIYSSLKFKPVIKLNLQFILDSYKYGIKAWMGSIANRANDKLDQLILSIFYAPEFVGVYSVAYNYSMLQTKPSDGIFSVFFNKMATEKNLKNSIKLAEQIHRSLIIITIPISILLMIFSKSLIEFMYGNEFVQAYRPVLILIPGIFLYRITRRILQLFLASKGKPIQSSIIQISGALISTVLYLFLIPKYDIFGAALATTMGFLTSTFIAVVLYKKMVGEMYSSLFTVKIKDFSWVISKLKSVRK